MARPREYCEKDLLNGAMHIFWQHGYAPTTMAQIVEATGVNRASLYAAFPDKRTLFLSALRHYMETISRNNAAVLLEDAPAAGNIRRYFARILGANPAQPPGCLLTHTAAEWSLEDQEVAELIRGALLRLESIFRQTLQRARDENMLDDNCEIEPLAASLVALVQGLRIMSRLGMPRTTMEQAVYAALKPLR